MGFKSGEKESNDTNIGTAAHGLRITTLKRRLMEAMSDHTDDDSGSFPGCGCTASSSSSRLVDDVCLPGHSKTYHQDPAESLSGRVSRFVSPAPVKPAVPIIHTVYVDDLTVLIVAASPASRRRALDTSLISRLELFTPLRLVVNWNPGKTEVMLRFRGSGSVAEYEKLRSEHGFGAPIQGADLRVNVALQSNTDIRTTQMTMKEVIKVCVCVDPESRSHTKFHPSQTSVPFCHTIF